MQDADDTPVLRPGEDGLTSDTPYRPTFADPADAREVLSSTRPGSTAAMQDRAVSVWEPPQGRGNRTLLPAIDGDLEERLAVLARKLDDGEPLASEELRYLVVRAGMRVLGSRRPSAAASALRTLASLEQAVSRREEAERARREEEEERRRRYPTFRA